MSWSSENRRDAYATALGLSVLELMGGSFVWGRGLLGPLPKLLTPRAARNAFPHGSQSMMCSRSARVGWSLSIANIQIRYIFTCAGSAREILRVLGVNLSSVKGEMKKAICREISNRSAEPKLQRL
jgi:hypothetical protein